MSKYCCVCGTSIYKTKETITFHHFPLDPVIRETWVKVLQKDYTKERRVCSQHFTPQDYKELCDRPLLKQCAIPSRNIPIVEMNVQPLSNNEQNSEQYATPMESHKETEDIHASDNTESMQRERAMSTGSVHSVKRTNDSCDGSTLPTKRYHMQEFGLLRKADFVSDIAWSRCVTAYDTLRKDNKTLQRTNERLLNKIQTLHDLLEELKSRDLITESAAVIVGTTCSPSFIQLIGRRIQNNTGPFPDELKQFACTLHFYSPAAYEYVRKTFMNVLPNQRTIRKWLGVAKHDPGISVDAMKHVSELCKSAEAENKKVYFSLTCDEMAIRRLVEFDGKEWHGYVNIGDGSHDIHNNTEATNALVFMLVGINSYFKIVVAYYLIHTLTGKERSHILSDILHIAHAHAIPICNITFDGATTNIAMVEALGAKLSTSPDELITHIEHPVTKEPITVMLDAVHMLKLIRNTLAAKQVFTDMNGNCIAWKYLTLLVELQEEEGLHLATKIRRKHIHFHNEKMKVRLAVQTFSSSVANALTTCLEDYKLVQLQGAAPTAEFCQRINDIFDLLNSRNRLSKKPTQRAITADNLQDIKWKAESCIEYIARLKLDTTPIIRTRNKTGFLGMIICLKSVLFLAEVLFAEKYMTFLLTYKLSQDHLETFFSCIRRCGGYNNNPTVRQFIAALKKLHAHVNINIIFNSNCTPKDDTILLQENTTNYSADENNSMDDFIWDVEHDYAVQPSMTFSEYQKDVLAYIAGFVAKQTANKLKCPLCVESLKQLESPSKLQRRKCYGTLFNASDDVVKLCTTAETIIRTNEYMLTSKTVLKTLIYLTLTRLQVNELFTTVEHAFDQAPLMDHRNQLIRILLEKFFTLRIHHYAASRTNKIERIRSKFTKLILLKHQ